eukprot:Em0018g376a
MDVFGKALGLQDAERELLGRDLPIFLRKELEIDGLAKKGEQTGPKILIISSSRCFLFSKAPTLKLDVSFNYLRIHKVECSETKLTFHLETEVKPREFKCKTRDAVEIIALITAQYKNIFTTTPLEDIIQLGFDPKALGDEVTTLRDTVLRSMERNEASSLNGFIRVYGFLCDYLGVPISEEIPWFLRHIYFGQGKRILKLSDFSSRDLQPFLRALKYNHFFEGLVVKDFKLSSELLEEIAGVLAVSPSIKTVVLSECSLKPEFVGTLATSMKGNSKAALTHLDLSGNTLDDKAVELLGSMIESLPHGVNTLILASCKITSKGGSSLANSMKLNKKMQYTLTHLDLSSNPLGPDHQGSLAFLQEPNHIAKLNLSQCGLAFEAVMSVLSRGCNQFLEELNMSNNIGATKPKKGTVVPVAPVFQQYFSSAIAISSIDFTDSKLTADIAQAVLEGLEANPNVQSVSLNLSLNDLAQTQDEYALGRHISSTKCLTALNISSCGLEDEAITEYVSAASLNPSLKHLSIGGNFSKSTARSTALKRLASLLATKDGHIESLSLSNSKLKENTVTVLESLLKNNTLLKLDISGNSMSSVGVHALVKLLLINTTIREIVWDRNDISIKDMQEVAAALEHNYTLRVMPLPLHDMEKFSKDAGEGVVQRMQAYLCRNHSDEQLKGKLQLRRQHNRLKTAQQAAEVNREVVALEDVLKATEKLDGVEASDLALAQEVKDQANKVLQLVDGLYTPVHEDTQVKSISAHVASIVDKMMMPIFEEHIKESSEKMVSHTVRSCSTLLSAEDSELLRQLVVAQPNEDFFEAKKTVAHKAVPEIINYVSLVNTHVATSVAEHAVDCALENLESSVLNWVVSRRFTFRVKEEDTPNVRKKRTRKIDQEDGSELPGEPLATEGAALQHLGKSRPKPARLHKQGSSMASMDSTDGCLVAQTTTTTRLSTCDERESSSSASPVPAEPLGQPAQDSAPKPQPSQDSAPKSQPSQDSTPKPQPSQDSTPKPQDSTPRDSDPAPKQDIASGSVQLSSSLTASQLVEPQQPDNGSKASGTLKKGGTISRLFSKKEKDVKDKEKEREKEKEKEREKDKKKEKEKEKKSEKEKKETDKKAKKSEKDTEDVEDAADSTTDATNKAKNKDVRNSHSLSRLLGKKKDSPEHKAQADRETSPGQEPSSAAQVETKTQERADSPLPDATRKSPSESEARLQLEQGKNATNTTAPQASEASDGQTKSPKKEAAAIQSSQSAGKEDTAGKPLQPTVSDATQQVVIEAVGSKNTPELTQKVPPPVKGKPRYNTGEQEAPVETQELAKESPHRPTSVSSPNMVAELSNVLKKGKTTLKKVSDDSAQSSTPAPVNGEPAAQSTTPKPKPKPKKNLDEKALEHAQVQSPDKSQDEKAGEHKSEEKTKTLEQDKQIDKDSKGTVTESQKAAVLGDTAVQAEPKKEDSAPLKVLPESANMLTDTAFHSKETLPTAEKSNEAVPGAPAEH